MIKTTTTVTVLDVNQHETGVLKVESTDKPGYVFLMVGIPIFVNGEDLIRAVQNALNVPMVRK